MASNTLSKRIGALEALVTNAKPLLPEMPHLSEPTEELETLLVELKGLESLQDVHKAQLRETNARRIALEKQTRDLRNRLIRGLQSRFGLASQKLLEFGINPRTPTRRRFFLKKPPVQHAPQNPQD
jgi:hypothetical protein